MPLSTRIAAAGRAVLNRVRARRVFRLEEIQFLNGIDIWYARIPDPAQANVAWLEPRPAGDAFRHHLTPAEVRPVAGNPHWAIGPHANAPVSWPVAFVRGPNVPAAGPRQIRFRIRGITPANYNGRREIKADTAGGLQTDSVVVQFNNGVATGTLTLTTVPGTVQRFSREVLRWQMRRLGEGWQPFAQSEHTFFFVLEAPLPPLGAEKNYFEMFDWSCRWAQGQGAPAAVLQQVWQRFTTVGQPHDTGLIYWRDFQNGTAPVQDMAAGIRSVDSAGMQQYAVSCIVFDRMFCNALSLHGIRTAEMRLEAHPMIPDVAALIAEMNLDSALELAVNSALGPSMDWPDVFYHVVTHASPASIASIPADYKFTSGGIEYYKPSAWRIAAPAGHGNIGPNQWESHWIADVFIGGAWVLYDPSYGVTQPWQDAMAAATLVPPAAYEAGGVTFSVVSRTSGNSMVVPTANPQEPRLNARRLYNN